MFPMLLQKLFILGITLLCAKWKGLTTSCFNLQTPKIQFWFPRFQKFTICLLSCWFLLNKSKRVYNVQNSLDIPIYFVFSLKAINLEWLVYTSNNKPITLKVLLPPSAPVATSLLFLLVAPTLLTFHDAFSNASLHNSTQKASIFSEVLLLHFNITCKALLESIERVRKMQPTQRNSNTRDKKRKGRKWKTKKLHKSFEALKELMSTEHKAVKGVFFIISLSTFLHF